MTSESIHYREPKRRFATTANQGCSSTVPKGTHLVGFSDPQYCLTASFLSWKIAANGCADKVFVYEEKGVSASTIAFS
jgi:hypothetical protein